MGIFKSSLAFTRYFGLAAFLWIGFAAESKANTYDFHNNLPPTCERGQGNSQEVTCQSLSLQWNDRIDSTNQARQVTVLGNANLQNAQIYQDGTAEDLELDIRGDLTAGADFAVRAIINVDGQVSIGSRSRVTGSLSALGRIAIESDSTVNGPLQSNSNIQLASRTVVNGFVGTASLTTESGVTINGNINASGDVDIASRGIINGSISGDNISLRASDTNVSGNIAARDLVFLGHQARVDGNVTANNIETESSGAEIGGTARAANDILLNWQATIEGDAYAINIENNGGEILGTSYCQSSNGSNPVTCQEPASVSPNDFCSAFNDAIGFGVLGTSGFSAGNNSRINGADIREPDGGLTGTPTTPTPVGELDSVSPGLAELSVDFPTLPIQGPDIVGGTQILPGEYGQISSVRNQTLSFAGGSLDYEDTNQIYFIERLNVVRDSTVEFGEGIYFINEIVGAQQTDRNFTIPQGEKVIIHIGTSVNLGNGTFFNNDGSPSQLTINLHPGVTFSIGNTPNQRPGEFNFNGLIYSPYENTIIELGNNNNLIGGILSAGIVDVGNNTEFTFTEDVRGELTQSVGCVLPPGVGFERLQIIQPERLVSCRAAPVSVIACANNDCTQRFDGSVSVTLQPSQSVEWQGGNLVGTSGNNATLNFSGGEGLVGMRNVAGGTVQLSVSSSDPAANAVTLCTAPDCQTEFVESGLEIDTTAYTRAGDAAQSVIRAITTASDGSCQPRLQNRNVPVSIELECRDPATCADGQNFNVIAPNGSTISDPASFNGFDFDANGELAIDHTYTDVGALRLNIAAFLEEAPAPETPPIDDPEITLFGSSALDFFSIPYALALLPYKDDAVFTDLGERFAVAGETFAVAIESRNLNGDITPSFGQESAPGNLSISYQSSTQPSPSSSEVDGDQLHTNEREQVVANGSAIVSQLVWDEVGELTLNPRLTSYFSASDAVLGTIVPIPGTISRFVPALFEIGLSSVADAVREATCTEHSGQSYTYLGQPEAEIQFEVLARNAKGALTRNYAPNFYDAEGLQMASFELVSFTHGADRIGGTITGIDWNAGRFTFNDSDFVYPRQSDQEPDGPFAGERLGVRVAGDRPDEDAVDFNAGDVASAGEIDMVELEGELNLLYARLNLVDVSGPDNEPIAVAGDMQVFAFAGNPFEGGADDSPRFRPARFDNCTPLEASRFSPVEGPQASMLESDAEQVVAGSIPDNQFNWQLDGAFDPGNAELLFEYDINATPWLGFPWRNPGDSESPRALVTFGQYRGNDRIIFWLERGL